MGILLKARFVTCEACHGVKPFLTKAIEEDKVSQATTRPSPPSPMACLSHLGIQSHVVCRSVMAMVTRWHILSHRWPKPPASPCLKS